MSDVYWDGGRIKAPDGIHLVVMSACSVHMAMCQFLRLCVAYRFHMTREKEVNTRHWVIEVNFYFVEADPGDHTLKVVAFLVGEGQHIADFEEAIGDFPVHFKHILRYFYQCSVVVFAIGIGSSDSESELIARFHPGKILLEVGDHHTHAINKCQRLLATGGFYELPIGGFLGQGVVHRHHFVGFNNHF